MDRESMDRDPTGRQDADRAGTGYLDHLTGDDLRLLGSTAGLDPDRSALLRQRPAAVLELCERPELFPRVYGRGGAELVRISPFLAFLVAIAQAGRELTTARFVTERSGSRQWIPVFDAPQLRDFLAAPARRLFLAELLASFVRVASGRYRTRTTQGWRAERYSELDPVRLAQLAARLPAQYRPGAYRRLGDVSLFLTGVFPDYAAHHAFGRFDAARLRRAAGLPAEEGPPAIELLEELGQRWYRQAATLAPVTTDRLAVVAEVAERFRDARRVLNHVADHYLARVSNPWFGHPGT